MCRSGRHRLQGRSGVATSDRRRTPGGDVHAQTDCASHSLATRAPASRARREAAAAGRAGSPNVPDVDVPRPRRLVLEHVTDRSDAGINRRREQANTLQIADQARNARQFDQLDVKAVAEALASLPAPLRQATWLRDVEDASYTEIAATMHVPVETVLSHISRGRRTLYECLSARLDARECTTITTPAAPQARARAADFPKTNPDPSVARAVLKA